MYQSTNNGIRTTRGVLLLIALFGVLLAPSKETFAQTHTFQMAVVSGQETKLRHAINIDQNCKKMATPTVQITAPPSNGSVTVRQGQFANRGPSRFIKVICPERVLAGVGIYYKPHRGFRGTDQVSYRLFYEIDRRGNKTWDETVIVTVR